MKYTIEATIPTQQYGNIRPVFEVDENESEVLDKLENLWSTFGESPLKKRADYGELLKTFTGEEVYYNDDTHKYYDVDGNLLLSGSQYAKQFAKPFDQDAVSKAVSNKTGEPQDVILKKWSLGAAIANNYGTAVHDAVEFMLMGGDIEKVPLIVRDTVSRLHGYVDSMSANKTMVPVTEVIISDVSTKKVGRVDCLLVDDVKEPKNFIILDYKTNRELKNDKLKVYTKQLEYYRDTLTAHGMHCKGLFVVHDDGENLTDHDVYEQEAD
tara:strand:+ start:3525 stop:4328 length:804 start_codon:yes stop_codon:yes gene_type:complete